jgi:hypothetical protein
METEVVELDQLQNAFQNAVEAWISAIREEESLASGEHSVADLDRWELAAEKQQTAGDEVKAAKRSYEDALRRKFFNF